MKNIKKIVNFNETMYLELNPDVKKAVLSGVFKSGKEHYVLYGYKENRKPYADLDRKNKIFFAIDKKGIGLEIGPSHNPIAPKKEGFNVHVLDHMSKRELRKKYKKHDVNINNIEDVDYVWRGESYQDLIGKKNYYDWIISSHVVEHVPDLISHLQQCEALLKPKGILSLVIPDKRYCFDYFLPTSYTGQFLDAYQEKRTTPSVGQIFDHFSNSTKCGDQTAWDSNHMGVYDLIHNYEQAIDLYNKRRTSKEYIDSHCWRFTPSSFKLVISDLQRLDLIGLTIKKSFDTFGCEFYVSLKKTRTTTAKFNRIDLLKKIRDENFN